MTRYSPVQSKFKGLIKQTSRLLTGNGMLLLGKILNIGVLVAKTHANSSGGFHQCGVAFDKVGL